MTVPDIAADDDKLKYLESDSDMIENRGQAFRIHSTKLSKALSYLMPKNREIILLFYFTGMTDAEIGGLLKIDRATVNRRRKAAESQLRDLMEGTL